MTTANDQINGALRVLGVLAEGETPSAATSQDALMALNQMIDSWNTEDHRYRRPPDRQCRNFDSGGNIECH